MRLQVKEISKQFNTQTVLDRFSLQCAAGELVLLQAPSGAGKTTLLRIIAGLELSDAGSIEIEGQTVSGPTTYIAPARRGIGMVFQDFALWPRMTVEQHLQFVLTAQLPVWHRRPRLGRIQPSPQTDHILDLCELTPKRQARPSQLSGGEQQRVAIARALITKPPLLLLDEPLAHLHPALRTRITQELAQRLQQGAAILVATHDPSDFTNIATRTYALPQHTPGKE